MTIPEDMIRRHLDGLLTGSKPGAIMNHLCVVAAPRGAVGPLGLPEETQLKTTVYAIAPDQTVDVREFIGKVIKGVAVEADQAGTAVLFAGLGQEVWGVYAMDDRVPPHLAQEGRLHEHPNAAEATLVYAAAADGRRWRGMRWLTGPEAGTGEHIDQLAGRPQPEEGRGVAGAALLRRLVGQPR